jgi:hypothetical protein
MVLVTKQSANNRKVPEGVFIVEIMIVLFLERKSRGIHRSIFHRKDHGGTLGDL